MKKIRLLSVISTLLICSSFFFVSCQKKEAAPTKNEVKQEIKVETPKGLSSKQMKLLKAFEESLSESQYPQVKRFNKK